MLNKIEKLEQFLNDLLVKVFGFIGQLFSKIIHLIIPQKVFTSFNQLTTNSKIKIHSAFIWLLESGKKVFHFLNNSKTYVFASIDKIQAYPFKPKIIGALFISKDFLTKTKPKDYYDFIKVFFVKTKKIIKNRIGIHDPKQVKVFGFSLTLLMIGAYGVYLGFSDIYQDKYPSRAPASVQEYDYRPPYHLYEQKFLKIQNVKLPISVEDASKMDSITIDFGLRLSTRFARHFINEYEYRLKDYFFTAMEPVVSSFPIEDEGKEILREKIQEEINTFLKEHNVEGHVEEVYILYIVGS